MAEIALRRPASVTGIRPSDAAMAALWLAVLGAAIARGGGMLGTAVLAAEVSALAAIGWWDSRTLRAPNRAVVPTLAATLAVSLLFGAGAAASALGGAAVSFAAMLLLALLGRGRLGGGDVKFSAAAGAVCGLTGTFTMLAAALIAGGLVAAVVLALRLRKRTDVMAFTPLLLAGVAVALALQGAYHQS